MDSCHAIRDIKRKVKKAINMTCVSTEFSDRTQSFTYVLCKLLLFPVNVV